VIPVHPDLAALLRTAKPRFCKPTDNVFASVPVLKTFRGYIDRKRKKVYVGDLARAGILFEDD
jgi:hypothetical protein